MILFLDFDGVTHFVFPLKHRTDDENQHFAFLPRLEAVLRDHPDWKVVISSSWREVYPWDKILDYFSADIQPRIIGATPVLKTKEPPYPAHPRFLEIQLYLADNNHQASQWIALDDDAQLFPPDCPNLVLCDEGFFEAEEIALRKALGSQACRLSRLRP